MKKSIAVIAIVIGLIFSAAATVLGGDSGKGEAKLTNGRGGRGDSVSLTSDQKAIVKSILSKYNPSGLTADDANAIHKAFRDAGLRGGRRGEFGGFQFRQIERFGSASR